MIILPKYSSDKNHNFEMIIGNPVVIAQGKSYSEVGWGPYQSPHLGYTVDGNIFVTFNGEKHNDNITGYEDKRECYISSDSGDSWVQVPVETLVQGEYPMKNGCYFQGIIPKNAYKAEWIKKYKPEYSSNESSNELFDCYKANKINEFDKQFYCKEFDPSTGEFHVFKSNIEWDNMPLIVLNGLIMPIDAWGGIASYFVDGDNLYMIMYSYGFDSESGAVTNDQYNLYFFKSDDNARNWTYIDQILSVDSKLPSEAEGFCEADVVKDKDGSFRIIMRIGAGISCYTSKSVNDFQSWEMPEEFIGYGVCPQFAVLDNGIMVASYGRPGVYITAAFDETRTEWIIPYKLEIEGRTIQESWENSCCYTSLLKINGDEVLLAYSNFKYPNLDAKENESKTILVRKIKFE